MPIIKDGQLAVITHSPEQTQRLAARLGALLQPGDVVCLSGDMGAGKTVFASGVGQGWGALHPLHSPTYTLIHHHQRQANRDVLLHIDLYRLDGDADAAAIGLDELLDGAVAALIEWPERAEALLPPGRLWVRLKPLDVNRRDIMFTATGARPQALIAALRAQTFGA